MATKTQKSRRKTKFPRETPFNIDTLVYPNKPVIPADYIHLPPPPSQKVLNDYLKSLYTDIENPGSFQGVEKLYDAVVADKTYRITTQQIKQWLESNQSYTLHRKVSRVKKRPRVLVSGIDDQFEADLAELSHPDYVQANDGVKYLLIVIDIFSRFLWVQPLTNKYSSTVLEAFKKIINSAKPNKRIPRRLRTDRGTEFTSKTFKTFNQRQGITQMFTSNEQQANYAERVIQTLKKLIFSDIVHRGDFRYVHRLPALVKRYNNSWHSGIRAKPAQVNKSNEKRLWWQMYWPTDKGYSAKLSAKLKQPVKFAFKVNDKVRMSLTKRAFAREYDERWTGEVFLVRDRFVRPAPGGESIPMYKLNDYAGDAINGTFYQNELQRVIVPANTLFVIEKILKEEKRGRQTWILVKYKYWPDKFNRWMPKKDLIHLRQKK